MTVNFEYEASEKPEFDYEDLVQKVISACLDYEDFPYETETSVLFTDDQQIHEINQEYRDIDAATDVLSFPTAEYTKPGCFEDLEDRMMDCFHPETGEFILGDIVISVERARKQSEEYGHSMLREIAFLTAHSMLHLMGYDHMTEEDRIVMERKQEEVLQQLGIVR